MMCKCQSMPIKQQEKLPLVLVTYNGITRYYVGKASGTKYGIRNNGSTFYILQIDAKADNEMVVV